MVFFGIAGEEPLATFLAILVQDSARRLRICASRCWERSKDTGEGRGSSVGTLPDGSGAVKEEDDTVFRVVFILDDTVDLVEEVIGV